MSIRIADKLVACVDQQGTALTLSSNKITIPNIGVYYCTSTGISTLTIALPTHVSQKTERLCLFVNLAAKASVNFGTSHYLGGEAPDLSTAGWYEVFFDYVPGANYWSTGALRIS